MKKKELEENLQRLVRLAGELGFRVRVGLDTPTKTQIIVAQTEMKILDTFWDLTIHLTAPAEVS